MSRVPIFTFHALDSGRDLNAFLPERFEAAMHDLARSGWTSMELSDLVARVREGLPLPPRRFALTFDDGYESVHEHALPVLRRLNLRATLFLSVGRQPEGGSRLPSLSGRRMLSWAQVEELCSEGVELGAHGCRHVPLTGLGEDEVGDELATCTRVIEARTGVVARGFSYPFGRFDGTVVEQVQRAGFDYAVSDRMGEVGPRSDRFTLERVETFYFRHRGGFRVLTGAARRPALHLLGAGRAIRRALR